jgi:hypothetical protein
LTACVLLWVCSSDLAELEAVLGEDSPALRSERARWAFKQVTQPCSRAS